MLFGAADMPEGNSAIEEVKPKAADEDMADPPVRIPRSRWLDEEQDEEAEAPVNKVRDCLDKTAASDSWLSVRPLPVLDSEQQQGCQGLERCEVEPKRAIA